MNIYAKLMARRVIDAATGCWLWPGATSGAGYGVMGVHHITRTYNWYVHRLMAWLYLGYDGDPQIEVCHRCNVKTCFNPDHLYLASHTRNMADAGRDSLLPFGARHHATKLTEEDVHKVWSLLADGMSWARIARRFNVATGTIQHIVQRRTWKRVQPSCGTEAV